MPEENLELEFTKKYLPLEYKSLEWKPMVNQELYDEKIIDIEVKKEMEIDEDAAIISNKGFIVAYDGKVDEEVLNNLVRFITPPSSVTTERALTLPSAMRDGISVGSYYLWSNSDSILEIVDRIEKVMKNSGKI